MFVETASPSRTLATSRSSTVRPPTERSGMSRNAWTVSGLALISTGSSRPPSRSEPDGRVRFCWLTTALTSEAVMSKACKASGSRSIMTCREAPP